MDGSPMALLHDFPDEVMGVYLGLSGRQLSGQQMRYCHAVNFGLEVEREGVVGHTRRRVGQRCLLPLHLTIHFIKLLPSLQPYPSLLQITTMNAPLSFKDTFTSTNYRTRCVTQNDFALSGVLRKPISVSPVQVMQDLNIEVETLMERLEQKVVADERKTAQNSQEMEEISKQMSSLERKKQEDKQMDVIVRNQREKVKVRLQASRNIINKGVYKAIQPLQNVIEGIGVCERAFEEQKQQKDVTLDSIIAEMEIQMLEVEDYIKSIRIKDRDDFQQVQLSLYQLEQSLVPKLEQQITHRKHQHQTITQLIGHSIEKLQYMC